jgi:hypothetical protein
MRGQLAGPPDVLPGAAEIGQLEARVQARLMGRVRDLRLSWREGGLVLQGQAPTYYAKQLAQHAVLEVTAFPIAANEIQVWGAGCRVPRRPGPVEQ